MEVGAKGGVTGELDFDLEDPNGDGKIRFDELVTRFRLGPACIFDTHGSLDAGVRAFVGPDGELRGTLGLGVRGILPGTVIPRGEVTPYVERGELRPGLCCIIAVSLLAFTYKRKPCLRE